MTLEEWLMGHESTLNQQELSVEELCKELAMLRVEVKKLQKEVAEAKLPLSPTELMKQLAKLREAQASDQRRSNSLAGSLLPWQ